jgi:hypothetical protein
MAHREISAPIQELPPQTSSESTLTKLMADTNYASCKATKFLLPNSDHHTTAAHLPGLELTHSQKPEEEPSKADDRTAAARGPHNEKQHI